MGVRKFGLGVVICIFNRDFSKILLLKRNEEKRKKGGADWGNVGGRVELGERLVDACIREAKEEIGVNLNPKNFKLIEIKESPYLTEVDHALHFVYAALLEEQKPLKINTESDSCAWFSINALPDKMIDSRDTIKKIRSIAMRKFRERSEDDKSKRR